MLDEVYLLASLHSDMSNPSPTPSDPLFWLHHGVSIWAFTGLHSAHVLLVDVGPRVRNVASQVP